MNISFASLHLFQSKDSDSNFMEANSQSADMFNLFAIVDELTVRRFLNLP
jgi:hypothetical protein